MAPLAVPHHFLRVSPLCNNLFLHDFMGIEGEKKKVCFICKTGSSRRDVRWFVCTLPPYTPSSPILTPLTPVSSLFGLVSPGSAGRGGLWSLAEGRCGSISAAAASLRGLLCNYTKKKKKPIWWKGRGYVNSAAATVAPVSRRQMASALRLQSPKIRRLTPRRHDAWFIKVPPSSLCGVEAVEAALPSPEAPDLCRALILFSVFWAMCRHEKEAVNTSPVIAIRWQSSMSTPPQKIPVKRKQVGW